MHLKDLNELMQDIKVEIIYTGLTYITPISKLHKVSNGKLAFVMNEGLHR